MTTIDTAICLGCLRVIQPHEPTMPTPLGVVHVRGECRLAMDLRILHPDVSVGVGESR